MARLPGLLLPSLISAMFAADLIELAHFPESRGALHVFARRLENLPSTAARSTGAHGFPQVDRSHNGAAGSEHRDLQKVFPKPLHVARPLPLDAMLTTPVQKREHGNSRSQSRQRAWLGRGCRCGRRCWCRCRSDRRRRGWRCRRCCSRSHNRTNPTTVPSVSPAVTGGQPLSH